MDTSFKYPRTFHFPWSPGLVNDDRMLESVSVFHEMSEIVVTEKLDGENTSMYRDNFHARSLDGRHHPSRDWVKRLHGQIAHEIPEGWRICGENMLAVHSIEYHYLRSYFYVFGIYNEENVCLSWDDTVEFCSLLGLTTVPELYRGPYSDGKGGGFESLALNFYTGESVITGDGPADEQEGYVVRNAGAFRYEDFSANVAKYVRKNHVQTSAFWMTEYIKNPRNNSLIS